MITLNLIIVIFYMKSFSIQKTIDKLHEMYRLYDLIMKIIAIH